MTMAKKTKDIKKEFVQKYMLDEYSRAIPTKALQGNAVSLGEYCDPIDSKQHQKKVTHYSSEDSDPDPGYADPQDSVCVKKKRSLTRSQSSKDDDGDVYELAKQPSEESNTPPPQRKPSPKPRACQVKKNLDKKNSEDFGNQTKSSVNSSGELAGDNECVQDIYDHPPSSIVEPDVTGDQFPRKRPSKKVVEIEYEVASAIRPNRPDSSHSRNLPSFDGKGDVRTSRGSSSFSSSPQRHSALPASSCGKSSIGPPLPQSPPEGSNLPRRMSQPVSAESVYEEPWDLKAKRLKQEQEGKRERLIKSNSETRPPSSSVPLYEQAWDSPAEQRKLEAKLKYARSTSQTSQTSEVEIFHDALESVPSFKADHKPPSAPKIINESKPQPTDTYEDAWDLRNNLLEQKIRQMQLEASGLYEEPWDSSKQQKQFQAQLQKSISQTTDSTRHQGSGSEAYDQAWEGSEAKPLVRGKYHSVEEKSKDRARGCNIGQRINPMIPLASQNWFHGNISRDDAEKMLCVCKEGSYIVRISSDRKSYSLSIKSSKQYIHVQIEQMVMEDSSIRYILGKNSKEFCSIPEMIDYYTHHRVPLKGAEHITLLHPVECKWS